MIKLNSFILNSLVRHYLIISHILEEYLSIFSKVTGLKILNPLNLFHNFVLIPWKISGHGQFISDKAEGF